MRRHDMDNDEQAQLAERRTRVDNETTSEMHPPRTVQEQVEELEDSGDDHRRRDPIGAAQSQQQPREEVSGGGPVELEDEAEGASTSETRQHFGSDVQTGPARADADAD